MTLSNETYEWPIDNTGMFSGLYSLSGRICRKEFAIVFLAGIGVVVLSSLIPILSSIVSLAWLLALIGEGIKRLHDMGISGKWLLFAIALYLISAYFGTILPWLTIVNGIVFLGVVIMLCVIPGNKGINQYGTNPTRSYREQTIGAGYPDI